MTYELQLFDDQIGQYIPVETGDDPQSLMDQAKGMARRVINAMRGSDNYAKPLPLKPRVLHGMSGKPRRYRPDTMIEPASAETLADRAIAHYMDRAENGESKIPVYVWPNTPFHWLLWRDLGPHKDKFTFIELDPSEFFS